MKRIIVILGIAVLLFSALIWEQVFINDSIGSLKTKCENVYNLVNTKEILNDSSTIDVINDLNTYWSDRESKLCLVINHKDMERVGEQIVKVLSLCKQNDKEQAKNEVELLKYYTDGYEHSIKLTFQNIW